VQSTQDIVSIIQHAFSLIITSHDALLTVRKLIFRHYTLYLVRLDAVSKTSVRLDRHTLNDGVNLWQLDLHPPLRPLTAMKDFVCDRIPPTFRQERDFCRRRLARRKRLRDDISAQRPEI
jgi:hypothetical protein